MTATPPVAAPHTRLLRFTLGLPETRSWLALPASPTAAEAFAAQVFGRKSERRVALIVSNLRARFDAFPAALAVLRRTPDMSAPTRRLVAHWHVQLSDPLYRAFTASFLADRAAAGADVTRDDVARWVATAVPGRWNASTTTAWASKLLSTAREAGLVVGIQDPRRVLAPSVPDDALLYLLHLLHDLDPAGVLEHPCLASVGLVGAALDERLRALTGVRYHRMGALRELVLDAPW